MTTIQSIKPPDLGEPKQGTGDDNPKGWWEQMKSSRFGVVGAVLGTTIFFPVAIVVGYRSYNENRERTLVEEPETNTCPEDSDECGSSSKILNTLSKSEEKTTVSNKPVFSNIIRSMQTTAPISEAVLPEKTPDTDVDETDSNSFTP